MVPAALLLLVAALGLITVACGGGEATESLADGPTNAPPSESDERTFTLADAETIVTGTLLSPDDLEGGWNITLDQRVDNVAAADAAPDRASLIEQCGRLLGRMILNTPQDPVSTFLDGNTVVFFSNVTVYATRSGAQLCAAEESARVAQPGELARTFGDVFVNPDAVSVRLIEVPAVGETSFAARLSGATSAGGTIIDVSVLIIGFLDGQVSGVVGSVRATAPPVDELAPLASLVAERIASATSALEAASP
jgi:hypothetical protein